IHGQDDEIVPESSVAKLVEKLSAQGNIEIDYRIVPGTGHFFNTQLDVLEDHVDDYLNRAILMRPPEPMPLMA
ncbi:MAG: prolyl oligopeptidase family serine peptidase, partial [Bdellovibrionales bacterium]